MRSRGQRGILFENEGSVLLGTMFTARDEPAPTAVVFHYRGSRPWLRSPRWSTRPPRPSARTTPGSTTPAHDAAPGPKELAIHPEADHAFIDLRPWLIERVVSWVERVASSHPRVPGRDG